MTMIPKRKIVLALIVLTFMFPGHFAASQAENQSWTGGFWQSIISFFGFDKNELPSSVEGGGDAYSESEYQNFGASDINYSDQTLNQLSNDEAGAYVTYDPTYNQSGDNNIACLPTKAEIGENILLIYTCPAGYNLINSSFGAQSNYGIKRISASQSATVEFIECKNNYDKINRYECNVSVYSPAINEFYVNPTSPRPGENVTVTWSSSDTRQCTLYINSRIVKKSIKGAYSFIYKQNASLSLKCETLDSLFLTKNLSL